MQFLTEHTEENPSLSNPSLIANQPRKVIMQAPKNGFFYVLDRVTGKMISGEPFAYTSWARSIT